MSIKETVQDILSQLPEGVSLVAAAKQRTSDEINQAIEAGIEIIGENYIQEAQRAFNEVDKKAKWHFIGHLQKNKVKKAIKIFDMIETVDSVGLAKEIDKRCAQEDKVMPILIEVNTGREEQKFGVLEENVQGLIKDLSQLKNIKVKGIMTMGPLAGNPEDARPYFKCAKTIFDKIKAVNLLNVEMKYLSMGMSNSYKIAIEEGANLIRIGTKIFGQRE